MRHQEFTAACWSCSKNPSYSGAGGWEISPAWSSNPTWEKVYRLLVVPTADAAQLPPLLVVVNFTPRAKRPLQPETATSSCTLSTKCSR